MPRRSAKSPAQAQAQAQAQTQAQDAQTPQNAPLRILMVAAEAVPFAKEGGVADVIGSLPLELATLGADVRVALPRYGAVDRAKWELRATDVNSSLFMAGGMQDYSVLEANLPGSSAKAYFIENEHFFGRHTKLYLGLDQLEEQRRFLLFCRGILDALPSLGFAPNIIHLHDWQAAPCAAYLRTNYSALLGGGTVRIVYTIHNLQYQGRWSPGILDEAGLDRARVFHPTGLEYWGDVNWMKAGIMYSDAITTVSRRYAEEIQTLENGWGLDEALWQRHPRVLGIPNGIDWVAWDPAADTAIARTFVPESAPEAKRENRTALRTEFDLPDDGTLPVIGVVSRLVDQKGFDLVADLAHTLADLPLQLVILGSGQPRYEELFRDLAETTPNVRVRIGFDAPLSRRIYAGSDFFLMPSAFEPGGLGQLIALRYGTLPIVRATGGLADTVTDLDAAPATGNGISFSEYTAEALLDALQRALRIYGDTERWPTLVRRAMVYNSRWEASAQAYVSLYKRLLQLPPTA